MPGAILSYQQNGMGVEPYHLIDITTKTFKFFLKYGLKRAFWWPKTHF